MAEVTKIKCHDTEYDIKDETARSQVTSLQSSVGTLTTRVNSLETGGTGGKGEKGDPGADGVTFTPSVSSAGVLSWSNDGGLNNPEPVNIKGAKGDNGTPGTNGTNGTDGVSPTVAISKSGKVTTITITDKNGDHVATINDGADGTGGSTGGSGDMTKAIYDTDDDGIVDNASKLGGQLPAYYAKASDLTEKVDVVSGKGLSTNDYTTAEKTKLSGVETGAQKNVQADWNATSGDAFIKNKPTIPTMPTVPTKVSDLENDAGYLTSYTETDPTVPSWAKASTKPTYTASEVGAAPTAHTHAYADLTGKPTIPTIYAYTVTLTSTGWSDETQTVTAAHVTADSLVYVSPAEVSYSAWQTAQIRCSGQGAGTLTFTCGGDAPSEAVTYNVSVIEGVS